MNSVGNAHFHFRSSIIPSRSGMAGGLLVAVVLLTLAALVPKLHAEILYDNTQGYLTNAVYGNFEFGDEVKLTRAVTNLTDIEISYDGEFFATGRESARVRLYVNDGPDTDPGPRIIRSPGTVIYDSGPMPMAPGANVLSLSGLSISVPQSFTWTVQFSGLTGSEDNRAGLLLYNPPSSGVSFDDFWQKGDAGWQLFRFGGQPIANFGARFETTDNILRLAPPTQFANGTVKLDVTGPVGREYLLEFSSNATSWIPIFTNRLVTTSYSYIHTGASNFPTRFYRASLLPVSPRIISVQNSKVGALIQFEGPLGAIYDLQSSANNQIWITVQRAAFPSGTAQFFDPAGAQGVNYRLVIEQFPGLQLNSYESLVNNVFQVELFGPPGRRFNLQASENLDLWTTVTSGVFEFATGRATWIDSNATKTARKFFRIQLAD